MFDRSLRVRGVVGIGAALIVFGNAVTVAAADPAPRFITPSAQATPRPGEGLSGADRSWLSLKENTPRLGEGLTGADRSWLPPTSSVHVASPPSAFHWGDAGIGAGTAAFVLVVASGSVVAVRRRVAPAH